MSLSIFLFELKYQFRSPAFWTSFILFCLTAFLVMTVTTGAVAHTNTFRNAPSVIVAGILALSQPFCISVAAMAADVILRDEKTGFSSIIYATRLRKGDYIWAKLLGAFVAASVCFLSVPIGFFLGTMMPWIDPDYYCRFDWHPYFTGYFIIALPSIFMYTISLASIATLTRSSMAAYVGVVLFLSSQFLFAALLTKYEGYFKLADFFTFIDLSGHLAVLRETQEWTVAELKTKVPELTDTIRDNRLLCVLLGLAAGIFMSLLVKLRGGNLRKRRRRIDDAPFTASATAAKFSPVKPFKYPELLKFAARCKIELTQIVLRPSYLVLTLVAFALSFIVDDSAQQLYGASIYPVTRVMLAEIDKPVTIFTLIASIFYGGELVWKERELYIHEIVESTAISNWAYLSAKLAGLILALTIVLLMCPLAGMILQMSKGYFQFEFEKYFLWFVLPNLFQFIYYAILTIFFQALSPNKYLGWGLTVLSFSVLIAQGLLFDYHPLYYFASDSTVPLSDLNGEGNFWIGRVWFQLYWGSFCIILLTMAHALLGRGVSFDYRARLSNLPSKLKRLSRIVLVVAAGSFISLGGFIYYNTNVLNEYWSSKRSEQFKADYERLITDMELQPEPSIVDMKLQLDIFPQAHKIISIGSYRLKNKTGKCLDFVFITSPRRMNFKSLIIQGARRVKDYGDFDISKFRFAKPLQPDQETTITFNGELARQGFSIYPHQDIVDNGTLLSSEQFAPTIGIKQIGLLTDKVTRKKYHLPLRHTQLLKAPGADAKNYIGGSWATSDITVSTSADQTPFCPGVKVSDLTENGRRRARFVSTQSVITYFSVQSGRYENRHRLYKGIDLGVYYDAHHPYDVDRMLSALGTALDYYQANFGPYQFKAINILESPDFHRVAVSLAGTIPFSEGLGFIAKIAPTNVDYVTYVTAHELAHQWWGHQLVGADEQGATFLSESLAQYSALMVMEKMYGSMRLKNLLYYELKYYLNARGKEQLDEQPLIKVENQPYLHYNKGALVLYLIKDRLGEAAVNHALRDFLTRYRYKGPPYPLSTDFEKCLLEVTKPEDKILVRHLLEDIMLLDLRSDYATSELQSDGTYKTKFAVYAHKYFADGQGNYTEAPLDESIDVGCFASDPTSESMPEKDVLLLERKRITSVAEGQWVYVVTKTRPRYVAIDPYYKWITRNERGRTTEVK
jgi:ABC-2 type transport system permease protein